MDSYDDTTRSTIDGAPPGTYSTPAAVSTYAPAPPVVTERTTTTMLAPDSTPFSFAAGFLGWGVASFFTLALLSVVLAFLGNAAYDNAIITEDSVAISQNALNSLGWAGIASALVAVFVGYFLGGYNAGRIDRYHGLSQGGAVVGWTVIFAIIGGVVATAAARAYNVGNYLAPYSIDWNALTTRSMIGLALTLAVMLGAALLGGIAAERSLDPDAAIRERRTVRGGRLGG